MRQLLFVLIPLALAAAFTGAIAAPKTGFSTGIKLNGLAPTQEQTPTKPAPGDGNHNSSRGWWQHGPQTGLQLLHAGPFASAPDHEPAIALLFADKFGDDNNFRGFLSVYRANGQPVSGHWRVSASAQLLYFPVPGPGRYIVRLRAGLHGDNGKTLIDTLGGPVTVDRPRDNK